MSPLHIAIDAHRLVCEPLTSGATYLSNLASEWVTYPEPPRLSLLLPFRPSSEIPSWSFFQSPHVHLVTPGAPVNPIARYLAQLSWQQRTIPFLLRQNPPDLYFSPFHLTPQLPVGLNVVTAIHDLCGLAERKSIWTWLHRAELWSACFRAKRLICVSDYTYSMLARWSPRSARKATVVHNGIKATTLPLGEARERLRGSCPDLVPNSYLLWIGHPCARKNLGLLFEIFGAHHQRFPSHKFAVVAPEPAHPELLTLAQRQGMAGALRLLTRLDNRTRDALYRCALALIFPSRCEGFGFPVLEAMYQGCPSFAYEQGPAREMISDILPMASQLSLEAFVQAFDLYLAKTIPEREAIRDELIRCAGRFSARTMAARTFAVLTEAAGREVPTCSAC